jgi:predicted RNase H-like nuclease
MARSTDAEIRSRAIAAPPLRHGKRSCTGREERLALLALAGLAPDPRLLAEARRLGAKPDDVLDACAAAWTAWRKASGAALSLPDGADGPEREMRIWY